MATAQIVKREELRVVDVDPFEIDLNIACRLIPGREIELEKAVRKPIKVRTIRVDFIKETVAIRPVASVYVYLN